MKVSIVIPTFNERDNVREIATRIDSVMSACSGHQYDIWFIDDSRDDTPVILDDLSRERPHIHYVHRTNGRGLGTAVVDGFQRSDGDLIIVMDADLQHPPELLPVILKHLADGVDIVIPSRFVEGGSDGGLNWFRKLVSWTARSLGRMAIHRLRNVSDCTGGYFGIRRSVIQSANLNPIGWKILMEVLVKGHYHTIHEVGYRFTARDAGESKMSLREQWNYLRHIVSLIAFSVEDRRFYVFCLVGGLGTLVNLVFLSAFVYLFHWTTTPSSITASVIAMGHNYLWNNHVTWKDRPRTVTWRKWLQLPSFVLISSVSIVVTAAFAHLFERLHWAIPLGQLIGIGVATVWSYMANNRFTWITANRENMSSALVNVTRDDIRRH